MCSRSERRKSGAMPADAFSTLAPAHVRSIQIRAALDLLFELIADENGVMRTQAIGDAALIDALTQYGTLAADDDAVTFLCATTAQLRESMAQDQPSRVTL